MKVTPIWSDSLGAKSMCTLVETPDINVLIDPGAAIMQPSYPAPVEKKLHWLKEAEEAVKEASKKADAIVVSHYHFDHFIDFDEFIYEQKKLFIKNPNEYINHSQRKRAENFLQNICSVFSDSQLEDFLVAAEARRYDDPMNLLPTAKSKDFGEYTQRRKELLEEGLTQFNKKTNMWNSLPKIPELCLKKIEFHYPENREFWFGETCLRFTGPLFHGVEYASVGWVFATVIEHNNKKMVHSSDVCGPIVEDYAEWIIKENPSILILDGPTTYLFPQMLNSINLKRAVDNIINIIQETESKIILDHHLLRERGYKKKLKDVYENEDYRKRVMTSADYLGRSCVLDSL